MEAIHRGRAKAAMAQAAGSRDNELRLEAATLLKIMVDQWDAVFREALGRSDRGLVFELRDVRNRWAHQDTFSFDDTYRALDSVQRLLQAVSAPQAVDVERAKGDLLRTRVEEQTRRASRKAAVTAVEGQPQAGLTPWREVITPHPDVASGRYQQAEFAADLAQVHRGEGVDEYRDPREFFRRTFITEGLRDLLVRAVQRLADTGGDPVIQLQTNFGGGKTHSLLALYHLVSGTPSAELAGVETVLQAAGVEQAPAAKRAVVVGTALSPSEIQPKDDGTHARTVWGELAWQLGGADGYALVAEADRTATNPGSALLELFRQSAPCVVLIDEWVAYARQLYNVAGLPAGSFDAHFTFAQALTESAKAVPGVLVVVSLPASDIEIGGEGGRIALEKLENVIGRSERAWRPATAEEGFEIVRRRLFGDVSDPAARDSVVGAFSDLYRAQQQEFPSHCKEGEYQRRMQAAYPIHPELFDRLYEDWSTLERFQRTRGVLRLMAAVIHSLWEREDRSLVIMPGSIPIDDASVQPELTSRYLEDNWVPVIESDVDGPNSLPLRLDRDNPNLGRYSACRRVARTLYLGSAPTKETAHRGVEDKGIMLGCVQPGERPAIFGDALRRLTDQATHVYVDGRRYWLDIPPSPTRLARDRAGQWRSDEVDEEIVARLRADKQRGEFVAVHVAPRTSSDVPDEPEARLVILGPDHEHASGAADSPARTAAAAMLEERGNGPRRYRNALVFLAPDRTRLEELRQAARDYLAWKSIDDERDQLGLDAFQATQAKTKRDQADDTVDQRIQEAYAWALFAGEPGGGQLEWEAIRLQGGEPPAARVSKKLSSEGQLITKLGSNTLRLELDRVPLWRGNHVGVRQLWDDFAQYLYLPRLKDSSVLLTAVQEGAASLTWEHDAFAYAEGFDEEDSRYAGLRVGQYGSALMDGRSVIVKPEVARAQLDLESVDDEEARDDDHERNGKEDGEGDKEEKKEPSTPRRFHGSVSLDPMRVSRDAGKIAEEVLQHLTGLVGAEAEVTLEIAVKVPEGVPEQIVRTVSENANSLKFGEHGFERE
jgi:hypothetical protein